MYLTIYTHNLEKMEGFTGVKMYNSDRSKNWDMHETIYDDIKNNKFDNNIPDIET